MLAGGAAIAAYGFVQGYRTFVWTYPNYWGGAVFAPFVVAVGLLMVLLSPFTIRRDKHVNPAEQPERVSFPHEDAQHPWTRMDR